MKKLKIQKNRKEKIQKKNKKGKSKKKIEKKKSKKKEKRKKSRKEEKKKKEFAFSSPEQNMRFCLYPIPDSQQYVKRGSCRRQILSGLLFV